MTAIQCKEFIDEEILTLFTGDDKYIQTYIRGVRNMEDDWYHVVEIYMVRLPHMDSHIVDFGSSLEPHTCATLFRMIMISPWDDLVTDGCTTICRFSTQPPLVICSLTIFLLVDSFSVSGRALEWRPLTSSRWQFLPLAPRRLQLAP